MACPAAGGGRAPRAGSAGRAPLRVEGGRGLDRPCPKGRGGLARRGHGAHLAPRRCPPLRRRRDRRGPAFVAALGGERYRSERGRHAPCRAAQAVADQRPRRISPGVRLFLHGLRDRRRSRREARAARSRGDRDGRRRQLSHAELGDRDVGAAGEEDDRGRAGQPRLRLHQPPPAGDGRRALQQPLQGLRPGPFRSAGDRLREARAIDGSDRREREDHRGPRGGARPGPRRRSDLGDLHRDGRAANDRGRRLLVGGGRSGGIAEREGASRARRVREREERAEGMSLLVKGTRKGREIVEVRSGAAHFERIGKRRSVFEDQPPYAVYLPGTAPLSVKAHSAAEIAVGSAPGSGRLAPRLFTPETMRRSVRGKELNTRYVTDILPETEPADSLLVVEVRTPTGHSSSYPPHKHDRLEPPEETLLEETYYHRLDPPQGFVFQRVYTDARDIDESHAVEDHDTVVVPRGYHPVVVPWGYRSYYLNVMAGPQRAWHFKNDPAHEWIIKK